MRSLISQRVISKLNIIKSKLATLIKFFFQHFNIVLLASRKYKKLLEQRDLAILKLIELDVAPLQNDLTCIVFSKDRVLQLHSLLQSYFELVDNKVTVIVIYATSDERHNRSYEQLIKMFHSGSNKVSFVKEQISFKETFLKVINEIKTKNVFFLVDDILFIKKTDLKFAKTLDTKQYILSLRHSPNLTKSYTSNQKQSTPNFVSFNKNDNLLQFKWFEKGNEWSDPWSLDGQVLSTLEVKIIASVSTFKAPNSLEAELKSFNSIAFNKTGLCYHDAKILNVPINRVQTEVENLSGSISPDYLLSKWNDGLTIDYKKFISYTPTSTHEEHTIDFRQRDEMV
jgi:hypothetical protein